MSSLLVRTQPRLAKLVVQLSVPVFRVRLGRVRLDLQRVDGPGHVVADGVVHALVLVDERLPLERGGDDERGEVSVLLFVVVHPRRDDARDGVRDPRFDQLLHVGRLNGHTNPIGARVQKRTATGFSEPVGTASVTEPKPTLDPDPARDRLLDAHRDLVSTTLDCAAAVAAGFEETVGDAPATRDSRAARAGLRAALDRAGALDGSAAAIPDLVDAAGGTLRASPVPAPPYVAVTADGPVLRATIDGERLVARIAVYEVVDGAFVWREPSPETAVRVDVRV